MNPGPQTLMVPESNSRPHGESVLAAAEIAGGCEGLEWATLLGIELRITMGPGGCGKSDARTLPIVSSRVGFSFTMRGEMA